MFQEKRTLRFQYIRIWYK